MVTDGHWTLSLLRITRWRSTRFSIARRFLIVFLTHFLFSQLKQSSRTNHDMDAKHSGKVSASQRLSNLRDRLSTVDLIPLQLPAVSNECLVSRKTINLTKGVTDYAQWVRRFRSQNEFLRLPILFLSAERDRGNLSRVRYNINN